MTRALRILVGELHRSDRHPLPVTEEWLADLSSDRYRPMFRLLDEADWQFLRAQRGYRPEMGKSLRRQRVQLFRAYLRTLEADYHRLCGAFNGVLSAKLAQRQAAFTWRMMLIRVRLFLYEKGLSHVDASRLVNLFGEIRLELTAERRPAERAAA
jgi:hypothetical protein